MKVRGKTYRKNSCGMTKSQAAKKAASLRKSYAGAAMKKMDNGKYCVGVRGKKKAKAKKRK